MDRSASACDRPLLRKCFSSLGTRSQAAPLPPIVVRRRGRDDNPISYPPARYRLGQGNRDVSLLRGLSKLDPGAADRSPMKLHPPATADDGRACLAIHALDLDEPNSGFPASSDGSLRSAHKERRSGLGWIKERSVSRTVETVFAAIFALLDFDQANAQRGVAIAGKCENAGDVDDTKRLVRDQIIRHRVSGANLDTSRLPREPARSPRLLDPTSDHCGRNESSPFEWNSPQVPPGTCKQETPAPLWPT